MAEFFPSPETLFLLILFAALVDAVIQIAKDKHGR